MGKPTLYLFAALWGFISTSPVVPRDAQANNTIHGLVLQRESTISSSIKSLAAIGDSYSAGIGAGNRLGSVLSGGKGSDYACSRYDHAYPNLVHQDEQLGDPTARKFQFKSCSGALTTEVLSDQIPALDANQQVILLSIGGNDVELTNVLNQCIFQWLVLNFKQVSVAKAATLANPEYGWLTDTDWDAYGRGCEAQLDHTKTLIDGTDFTHGLNAVLTAAKSKLAPGGIIYQTGYAPTSFKLENDPDLTVAHSYAKFFAEDLSHDCDNVSWSIWFHKLVDLFQPDQKLTVEHRRTMNELVDAVNAKISAAVDAAGPNVKFIDYDSQVGRSGGRFCEAGVDESPRTSNARLGLMFYELDFTDPLGTRPWKRGTHGVPSGTFEGTMDQFAQITLLLDPDAELEHEDLIDGPSAVSKVKATGLSMSSIEVPNLLPDGYGRVFHPQIELHKLIADLIVGEVTESFEQDGEASDESTYKASCKANNAVNFKRDSTPTSSNTRRLEPRAPVRRKPLSNPKNSSLQAFVDFFVEIKKGATKFDFLPGVAQVESWFITYRTVVIPIGATAVWHPFGNKPQKFIMGQLTGCTAVIAVSSQGIYAVHLWEGSSEVNGWSSMGKTYESKVDGEIKEAPRTPAEFQAVAVDIFGHRTSAADRPNRPNWNSLADLQAEHGDPFGDGTDVQIFIMHRAKGLTNRDPLYGESISRLKDKFAQLIPGSTITDATYWGDDGGVDDELQGTIVAQYTPYDSNGKGRGCVPKARVRVFYENNQRPVIDHSWNARTDQRNTKRQSCSDSEDSSGDGSGQQVALATYIDPGANTKTWDRLIAMPADKVTVFVANVVNGPDSSVNAGWTDVIPRALASGKTVLGYVRTGYLGVSFQKFTTRLGSSLTSDWVAQIQEDVDQWYRLYPGINGIFFDEGWNDCGPDNVNAELYQHITQHTKKKYPGAYTVLNPGAPMPQCFEHSADTLLTAEVSYDTYVSSGYAPCDWIPSDPRKIWHIIYDVPIGQVAAVAALARERGVGMLHITDDIEPNPYDTIPDDAYMQTFMDALSGGSPPNDGVFSLAPVAGSSETYSPREVAHLGADYTSATLSWPTSPNILGYTVYQDSVPILSLTPSMTEVTVGGLKPGEAYIFGISAVGLDGYELPPHGTTGVLTLALPDAGRTVSSTSVSATAAQSVFKARILEPYAFVRIFLFNGKCQFDRLACLDCPTNFGWPINFSFYEAACNQYMIEGGTLYRYSGEIDQATQNMPWKWTWQAEVQIVQDGYDWTWTAPIGTSTVDVNKYLVQVQGYGPKANVYHECPGVMATGGVYAADYCISESG